MRVSEVMTRNVQLARPDQSLQDAAKMMADLDAGILPVAEGDKLIGMITDRDIAIRAVGAGKGPQTPIREVMSAEVRYCFEDEDTDHVTHNMAEIQVRRLPVMSRDKRLVGIVSIGDMAMSDESSRIGEAMAGISQHGGQHCQTGGARA